ncbi:MAG: hypothetical protein H0V19_08365 [Euzebyales bacterium]|nr:hypothetical protein [Euzebyales bacterium]
MNRAQRRAARRAGVPEPALSYAESYQCPDCSADTQLQVVDGLPVLDVRHDDSCPRYRQMFAAHPEGTP